MHETMWLLREFGPILGCFALMVVALVVLYQLTFGSDYYVVQYVEPVADGMMPYIRGEGSLISRLNEAGPQVLDRARGSSLIKNPVLKREIEDWVVDWESQGVLVMRRWSGEDHPLH